MIAENLTLRPLWLWLPLATVTVCLTCFPARAGGPTDKDPAAYFDVRDQQEVLNLRDEAAKELTDALQLIDELEHAPAGANFKALSTKVGNAFLGLLHAGRLAERLEYWNEIAGFDLKLRVDAAHARLADYVDAVKSQPNVAPVLNTDFKNFPALADRLLKDKRTRKIVDLVKQNKFEDAEEALFQLEEPLNRSVVWHGHTKVGEAMKPFDTEEGEINQQLKVLRQKEVADKLAALRAQTVPNFAALSAQAAEAVKSVGATGQATVDQKTLDGPQALWELAVVWRDTQAKTMKTRALDWARQDADEKARIDLSQLENKFEEFARAMPNQLSEIIRADTARLSPTDIEPRYIGYLTACSWVLSESADPALEGLLSNALDQMLAKSPDLQTEVNNYREATDDLLRWREQAVKSYIHFHGGNLPTLEKSFLDAAKAEGKWSGLVLSSVDNTKDAALADPAPVAVPIFAKKMIGVQTTVEHVVGLVQSPAGNNPATSIFRARAYADVVWPAGIPSAAADLRNDLLSRRDPTSGKGPEPLTLRAAKALVEADRGVAELVGGKVTGLELDGLVPRCAAVEPNDPLVRTGSLPPESISRVMQQLIVHFTIEPRWIAHHYFIVAAP